MQRSGEKSNSQVSNGNINQNQQAPLFNPMVPKNNGNNPTEINAALFGGLVPAREDGLILKYEKNEENKRSFPSYINTIRNTN